MRFTVVWNARATDVLAALWAASDNRQSISDASARMDADLRSRGDLVGVPLTEDDWIYEAGPIAAIFRRSLDDRLIQVTDILKRRTDQQ